MKFNTISRFLSQPYPFYYEGRSLFKITAWLFVMALLFTYFFMPFSVNFSEHRMHYFLISAIHAMVPSVIIILFSFIPVGPATDEKWTVGKEILLLAVFLLLAGVGQFLIRDIIYDNPRNWSWHYLFEEVRNTFLVGMLFIAILIPLNFNRLYRQNLRKAFSITPYTDPQKTTAETSRIFIQTQVKSDDFHLETDRFLFARAERNYVEIHLNSTKGIEKLLKRITVKELETQLRPFSYILKTHRSYLVNLRQVEHITGNAQGYKLQLKTIPSSIPVSRNAIPVFEAQMHRLN